MEYTRISQLNKQFEELYDNFNKMYFNSDLPPCVITIQEDSTRYGAYGWCTSKPMWKDCNTSYYEINMCAEHNARTVSDVAGTLLHEMVHLYNIKHEINDTSRGGTYHNKRFKESAELHHLIVGDKYKYGYHSTTLDNESKEYVLAFFGQIHLHRICDEKTTKVRRPSTTRKYICPFCDISVRATKEVKILCYECQCLMEVEDQTMRKYVGILWYIKSGSISKVLEGIGQGTLKLWGLQNTKEHQCFIIIDVENELIVYEIWKNREFKKEGFYTNEDQVPVILKAV